MNESFYRLIYTLLPCLVGAYAAALLLTTRSISAARAWMLGLLIAAVLTLGATMVVTMGVPMDRSNFFLYENFLALFGSLDIIPTIILIPTARALRARGANRGVGIVVLVAVFLASAWLARSYAARFDLVQAVQ
jgi:hypothetical protein